MKILVTEPIDKQGYEMLEKVGEVIKGTGKDEETVLRESKDVDAILIRVAKITEKIITSNPNLKVVAKHGIGVDNIDIKCCTKNGVMVVNAPKSNTNTVAEHTVSILLAAAKNIPLLDRQTKLSHFGDRSIYPTVELAGKTLGLIGMGNIAKLVAKKLKGFDLNIIAYDPYVETSEYAEMVKTVDEIYERSDFISLHVPLMPKTKHMISFEQFAKMKKDVIVVNASRGGTIDEEALYSALEEGTISGAALDVFESEPPSSDNPLFRLNNVVVSPHNAALSKQALVNMATHAAKGICEVLEGETPEWLVNKELLND